MTTSPVVLKIGGRTLDAPGATVELAGAVARHPMPVVIVHGGGARVTDWCRRLGLVTRFHEGRRVTDEATLEVAVAVLAGLVNTELVAALRHAGVDAIGLSGVDGGLFDASPHPDPSLGRVGVLRGVRGGLLHEQIVAGRCPVIASIAAADGHPLNVNADDAAGAVARALRAPVLVLLSDVEALRLDGRSVARLDGPALDAALAHPDVRDGMKPKLQAARQVLEGGVGAVCLGSWQGPGTLQSLAGGVSPASGPVQWPGTVITRGSREVAAHVDTLD